ncbi:MAG TPA: HesA/MoeB/ThiF family protein [Firmicutes bacterium]|nr:HesA/MoeB/ThiF family protein [Bacillota bacterium]
MEKEGIEELSHRYSIPKREVELAALEEAIVPLRYQRNLGTIGVKGQFRLLKSRVGVVGAGGLGGLAVELLARMGIGQMVVVDYDRFTESNLNRQLLSVEVNLGKPKVEAARKRVAEINSSVELTGCFFRGDTASLQRVLTGCGAVLDCLDNLSSRFALEEACQKLKVPLVHGAIAGFLGQLTVIWPGAPLFSSIYGPPPSRDRGRGAEIQLGNPASTPALVASWQVNEAVKILAGMEDVLRNKLLIIDLLSNETRTIELSGSDSTGNRLQNY